MELQFDNHDERIRYYELILERNLENLPFFPLPDGYRYVFFRPGDRDYWIDIEKSAKEFASCEQGEEAKPLISYVLKLMQSVGRF